MSYAHKPVGCQGCPLENKGLGYVPGLGPQTARVAFVGQGPGMNEVHTQTPFFPNAPAGSIFTGWLYEAALSRNEVWIDNGVRCWEPKGFRGREPYGSSTPTRAAISYCWQHHVGPDICSLKQLEWLVPVGAPTRHFFMGPGAGERYCGTANLFELPEVVSDE